MPMNPLQLLAAVALGAAPLAAQASFTATSHAVGTRPGEIALGDVDGDGDLDFVVAIDNPPVDGVAIWRNDGSGAFALARNVAIAPQTRSVLLHDLDFDGDLDLAASTGAAVVVLPNLGGGTFGAAATHPVGAEPRGLTVADFDQDGRADLAVANSGSGSVALLRNLGGLAFAAAVTLPVGADPRNVVAADWNRDGAPDLAASNHDSRTVSVLANDGSGGFAPAATLAVGANVRPEWVTGSDTDRDGDLELVVALGEPIGLVGIFANPGTGAFGAQQQVGVNGAEPGMVLLVDLDGDRVMDLVTGNEDSNDVTVRLGAGGGTFGPAVLVPAGAHPDHLAAGDVDGNGALDLVVANRDSGSVTVLRNQTPGRPAGASMIQGGVARNGASAPIQLSSPTDAGRPYLAALSFTPGPFLLPDGRTLPIGLSDLLVVCLNPNNFLFLDSVGRLDGTGHAFPRFTLPAVPPLAGLVVHGAFVVLDPRASLTIDTISDAVTVVVQ
jgi:hypothetical protein